MLARYPAVVEAIETLEAEGFPIFAYDGSLGGQYPVICVVLFNPANGTCFASFGAHPDFGVALERTVTELLQGRGLKDLDVFTPPTFDDEEVAEHTNLETHFIDSSGLISWTCSSRMPIIRLWTGISPHHGEEFATLMAIFNKEDKEVYIADYEHLGVYACRIIVPACPIFIRLKICGSRITVWAAIYVKRFFRYQAASGKRRLPEPHRATG